MEIKLETRERERERGRRYGRHRYECEITREGLIEKDWAFIGKMETKKINK